jgi:hypothetical protein
MSRHAAEAALAELAGEVADLPPVPIAKASRPAPPQPAGTASSGAAAIWREKLELLREQEAICSDPAQRFTLKKQIEEAEIKLRGLGEGS